MKETIICYFQSQKVKKWIHTQIIKNKVRSLSKKKYNKEVMIM
jgi:hypothetical protein